MANYFGTWRTNFFQPRDLDAFTEWAGAVAGADYRQEGDLVAIFQGESDGGLPGLRFTNDDELEVEIDFLEELRTHVAPGAVAIVLEIGAEKLRYLNGAAIAIRGAHAGEEAPEMIQITLDDIYERVATAWPDAAFLPANS